MYNGNPNITCILGTGSNSCFYDGKEIIEHAPSLGFIMGDEASGNYFGKKILSLYFNKLLPEKLNKKFENSFSPKFLKVIVIFSFSDKIITWLWFGDGADRIVQLWIFDLTTYELSYLDEVPFPYLPVGQAWSPDNSKIAIGYMYAYGMPYHGYLEIYDLETLEQTQIDGYEFPMGSSKLVWLNDSELQVTNYRGQLPNNYYK